MEQDSQVQHVRLTTPITCLSTKFSSSIYLDRNKPRSRLSNTYLLLEYQG